MLAAIPVAGVNQGDRRDLGRTLGPAYLVVADDDHVRITADDANGIFDLLAFHFGGEGAGMLGGENASAQPMHGRLKT